MAANERPSGPRSREERKVERLAAAGGRVSWRNEDHCVMADPEGNEFCVAPERRG